MTRIMNSALHRRGFLHVGSASLLGLGLSDLLRTEAFSSTESKERSPTNVIMVWLAGGPATIDMWDMKPDAPSGIRGEFAPIDTSLDGLQVCEHLPKLAKVMHLGCVVRSVHHTLAAHGPGTELLLTGNIPNPALEYPALGSISAKTLPPVSGVPSFVTFGQEAPSGAGYLGAAYNPFRVDPGQGASSTVGLPDGFSVGDLTRRETLLTQFDKHFARLDRSRVASQLSQFQQQAIDILKSNKTREALEINEESEETQNLYGRRRLGMRLLAARRLVEAGVRFVTVGMPGWDTHDGNFGQLRTTLLPELDQALAALISDLQKRGMLDSTVVYCTGEFGRTPIINGGGGRDHWARAMSVLLAGGRFRRGYAHGTTDIRGMEPDSEPCSPMDVSATVLEAIGISASTMLTTRSGRPLPVIADGHPIQPLFA